MEHFNSVRQDTSILLLQLLPQLLFASKDQRRDVIAAQSEGRRNFVIAHFVVVSQHQRHAIFFRKLAQRVAHIVTPFGSDVFNARGR